MLSRFKESQFIFAALATSVGQSTFE